MRESMRASSGYLSPRVLSGKRRTGSLGGGGRGSSTGDGASLASATGDAPNGGGVAAAAPLSASSVAPPPLPGLIDPVGDVRALSDMLFSSYFNFLLICVPLGWAAEFFGWGAVPVFLFSFTSLIPLALVLGMLTEDLALRYGDTIGGLINATFGNLTEFLVCLSALRRGLFQVVSLSLVGSILSNMLFVLGCCYLVGGVIYAEQRFSTLANKAFCSLLFMACIALLIPTTISMLYSKQVVPPASVLALSRATAVVMLGLYFCYLYFTLGTHSAMVVEDARVSALAARAPSVAQPVGEGGAAFAAAADNHDDNTHHHHHDGGEDEEEEEEIEVPTVSLLGAMASLVVLTVLISVASEALTGTIESVAVKTGISTAFISVIILPIAGNAAEHLTAVVVAAKGKMDLAQSIALGSSLQIAMLALPFAVLAAWTMGRPYSLALDPFSALVLFLSVTHAYATSADGASNWLLGVQLIGTYVLIALPFLYMRD